MVDKPSVEDLNNTFRYDPETGHLFWKHAGAGRRMGRPAGYPSKLKTRSNYVQVYAFGRLWYAHLLIWAIVHGEWPTQIVDHINNDGLDNRIANLRLADKSQNGANSRKRRNNTSGFKGATYIARADRYVAQIIKDGQHYYLGYYKTAQEAHEAYVYASTILSGEFARAD